MYHPNQDHETNSNQNEHKIDNSSWNVYNPNYHGETQNHFQTEQYLSQSSATVAKKKSKAPQIIALLLAGIMISAGSGMGGAVLAQKFMGTEGQTSPSVIKQSVINTSDTGKYSTAQIADVAAATANTVVEITTETVTRNQFLQQYTSTGAGSGVVLTSDGYIITNNHVIQGASSIKVTMRNGTSYDATLVGTDVDSDIAVIKIDATDLDAAVLGDSDKLQVGELAVAIGNPLGQLGGTVTEGIISALDRSITIDGTEMHLLQTSAAINPGNSGGGLFNEKGELVGIVNAKTSEAGIEGLGFAIPVNTAKNIAEQLITNGYVTGKVRLGISLIEIPDERVAMQYGVTDPGVYVAQVTASSDAYYGGLRTADLIKSINGKEITTSQDVKDFIENGSVGDKLEFVIVRENQEQHLTITLTEYNNNVEKFIS